MIIFGIDPGTKVTGYGIIEVEGSSYRAIDYGCIKPPPNLKLSERYLIIFKGLVKLLSKYPPHAMVVETQYVDKNVQSAIKLGMARGIAILAAKLQDIPVFEYAPTKAKQAVTGKGSSSKFHVQTMVRMSLGLAELPPQDAADALALTVCHANSMRFSDVFHMEI